jgi:hypothetical protein
MRTPTDLATTLAFWRQAVALAVRGDLSREDARELGITQDAQAGFYRRTLAYGRHAVWVPVRIWLHQKIDAVTGELTEDERLRCQVNGQEADPNAHWLYCADHPITEEEFQFMCARADWAEEHAPRDAHATPSAPVDFLTCQLPTFKKARR